MPEGAQSEVVDVDEVVSNVVDVDSGDEHEDACVASTASAPSTQRGLPVRFRDYVRGRELGCGGSGKVYQCSKEGHNYAVKAVDLRRIRLGNNAQRQQTSLWREVSILKMLDPHRNIVKMHDAFQEGDWFLIVLELVPAGDLFSALIARQPPRLSEREAGFVLRQVASGLLFLHGNGVIHRDLKLENVLVVSQRRGRDGKTVLYVVKITDFGLAKDLGAESVAHSKVGTKPYTAPEVGLEGKPYDFTSDLWSLGVFLYVLLAGRFPFESNGPPPGQEYLDRLVNSLQSTQMAKDIVAGLLRLETTERLSLDTICNSEWVHLYRCSNNDSAQQQAKRHRVGSSTSPSLAPLPAPDTAVVTNAVAEAVTQASAVTQPGSGSAGQCGSHGGSVAAVLCPQCPTGPVVAADASREGVQEGVHRFFNSREEDKEEVLMRLLEALDFEQAIIFVSSPRRANLLERRLTADGT
jgi:serine/threonine protein kinase